MQVVVPAGGKSSRFLKESTVPKQLACDPVYQLPLISHILHRIERDTPIERLVIVGADDNDHGRRTFDYVDESHRFASRPELIFHAAPRRGMSYAMFEGMQRLERYDAPLLITVSDTVCSTYAKVTSSHRPIAVGASELTPEEAAHKTFRMAYVSKDGLMLPDGREAEAVKVQATRGVYLFVPETQASYCRTFGGLAAASTPDPALLLPNGEFRLNFMFERFLQEGCPVAVADVGPVAELNEVRQMARLAEFLKRFG